MIYLPMLFSAGAKLFGRGKDAVKQATALVAAPITKNRMGKQRKMDTVYLIMYISPFKI